MSDFCATGIFLLLVLLAMWVGSLIPTPITAAPVNVAKLIAIIVRDILRELGR